VIWLLFFGMFLATYLPRLAPLIMTRQLPLSPWVRRWLRYFPYAALGALIFPGILSAVPGRPWLAAAAGLVAAACSLVVPNISVAVVAAIACVLIGQYLPLG
jgi:branched-subunit amino acid transport protein